MYFLVTRLDGSSMVGSERHENVIKRLKTFYQFNLMFFFRFCFGFFQRAVSFVVSYIKVLFCTQFRIIRVGTRTSTIYTRVVLSGCFLGQKGSKGPEITKSVEIFIRIAFFLLTFRSNMLVTTFLQQTCHLCARELGNFFGFFAFLAKIRQISEI